MSISLNILSRSKRVWNCEEARVSLPFDGKNVAEGFGKQAAAIQALANILKSVLIDEEKTSATERFDEGYTPDTDDLEDSPPTSLLGDDD